ncbi:peptidyl-prolyl cis-trans isomerase-like 4 [Haliotis rufescens]|uniref:peptidyl-prolyl cis-trans isomerase-like 4 n=1 Tax=Haliotis rufescens TaxID=6454 RepID=UPI00201EA4D4|nr:peptidyl-prolyl cis-trans isomerase-like 4 [Haliotis rufescens]
MSVILETSVGDITIDLYTDERPRCCLNFLKLCKVKYYNFSLFHSVQKKLVAQTGDPSGTGKGGESIFTQLYGEQARFFDMETNPRMKHRTKGTVSMVNNGSGMHGSQFFITLEDELDYLDGQHTVFGQVAEGFEVLDKLNEAYCDEEHRPYIDIRIYHTVILDDPYDDPADLNIPDRSPEPTKEMLDSGRIGADEAIDDAKGLTMQEVKEKIEEKEASANAQLLEMVGDLPEADVRPPDDVLFVCKLNPVTTSEDLEMIFSRFGEIKSCEVIKDQKTGESLQYAFIEFEKEADCENAYFKMDNVLIDDRRIHVDFSQSVSKLQYNKTGTVPSKPAYALKDTSRKNDGYDLVFDNDDHSASSEKKKKEKKKEKKKKSKKHRSASSDSDSSDHKKSSKKHKKRARERSESPPRRKSRSRSPDRRKKDRRRSREREEERRERSRSPDRRHKQRDRYRDDRDSRRDRDRYR